ncbi:MAG: TIR domain-containing protein [Bacteroidota bacterium]
MSKQPVKVFISYAHKDEEYKDELNIYLTPYERKKMIEIWDDRDILPGQLWDNEINNALFQADVVLFLVSPYFMASGYIDGVELKNAMELHEKKSLVLIPIIIRPSDMSMLDISKFQAVPRNAKPISTWENTDEAWLDVTSQIGKVFRAIYNGDFKLNKNPESTDSEVAKVEETNILAEVEELLAEGELKEALTKMMDASSDKYPRVYNDLIMQSARVNQLNKEITRGTIDPDRADRKRNQLQQALIAVLGDLKKEMK